MVAASSSSHQSMLQARHIIAVEEEEGECKTPDGYKYTIIVAYGELFEEWHVGNVWSVGGSKFVLPDAAGPSPPSLTKTKTSSSNDNFQQQPTASNDTGDGGDGVFDILHRHRKELNVLRNAG